MKSNKIKKVICIAFFLLGLADLVYGIFARDTFSIIVGPVIMFFSANAYRQTGNTNA